MPAIAINGLEKVYTVGFWRKKEKTALKPLHLTVEHNEVFGFLGPNGAGKTTTLKLLMGLIFPTSGSAKILDLDSQDPRVKTQIGFLPEQPYFYDHLTAPELLRYYAQLSGVPAREQKQRVAAVLDRVGLPDVGRLQLRKFSKGMLQRVGIAQAILHGPKVVFLDEPTSGLDPMGRREVREIIQAMKDEGKTIFFSTHILSDAEALCDRVAVIDQGALRGVGVVADLVTRDKRSARTEVVWSGPAAIAAVTALGGECRLVGTVVRATVLEAQLDSAIDAVRRHHGKIISVTPIHSTLEDYFLRQLGEKRALEPQLTP